MAAPVTILNVDDNEPGRYAKGRVLSRAGFTVYEAATGGDALSFIARQTPDLVLLDINLPDVSGIEVCRQVKSGPSGASTIVLQISATAVSPPHATAALDNGADAYLTEPVDPDVLVATVNALLRVRKAERELSAANERLARLNQELSRSNDDLEQFASAASHDLQEPLRTVTSYVTLLERSIDARLTIEEREYLRYISEGSRRMRALIEDLLSYSHVGHKPASLQIVDLNALLGLVLESLGQSISETEAEITSDPLPSVAGDHMQLGQVLQNLIGNAIKYARPEVKPVVHLSAASEKEDWVIRIRDNGIGIDSGCLQVIFVPFKRLHEKEVTGTGIGLAVCRRVVEAHGGKIWAESIVGQGSTFFISLPGMPSVTASVVDGPA